MLCLDKMDAFVGRHRNKLGITLVMVVLALVTIGCTFVFSSSSILALKETGDLAYYFKKQAMFAIAGFIGLFIISNISSKTIKKLLPIAYIGVIFLLILVRFIGTGDSVGARSWIRFGGIGIQPSELAKITMVLTLAYFLEKKAFSKKDLKKSAISLSIALFPMVLVIMEGDLGSTAILAVGFVSILFFTEIPLKFFAILGGAGAVFLGSFMTFRGYRMARITAWLKPFEDPQGISYQIVQSFYAIANGGIFGTGIGSSKQKYLWLPEQHTDFIFSIICEETGLWGPTIIVLLFLSIFAICMYMSRFTDSLFRKYSIIGIGSMISFQAFLNIMVTTGLFPVTGITLPFISYGGTSLVVSTAMIGLIFALYHND